MMTDPISDMLTRIRNANGRRHKTVPCEHSNLKESIVKVFFDEGFIEDYHVKDDEKIKTLVMTLKYRPDGTPVIRNLARISKPGNRVRRGYNKMKPVVESQGILVVSTSKGVVSDNDCRSLKVGGEILCEIY